MNIATTILLFSIKSQGATALGKSMCIYMFGVFWGFFCKLQSLRQNTSYALCLFITWLKTEANEDLLLIHTIQQGT